MGSFESIGRIAVKNLLVIVAFVLVSLDIGGSSDPANDAVASRLPAVNGAFLADNRE